MNDSELLRLYVEEGSQESFAEVVRLHLGLVYSAALRQTGGDAHRAQEVAQSVFTDLARKAPSLYQHGALIGWLYTSTRYAAAKMARAERRRRRWEEKASTMHDDLASPTSGIPGERLRPLLDEVMHQLSETDRRALLLRFFEGCSMAELGGDLGISESTAKKRVERALAKLKSRLAKRGLASTAAAIGAALSQEALAATAPAGLAATISGSALVAATTAVPGLGLISLMTTQKLVTLVGVTSLLGLLSIGVGLYEWRAAQGDWANMSRLSREMLADQSRLRDLEKTAQAIGSTSAAVAPTANTALRKADAPAQPAADARKEEARAIARAFFNQHPEARTMFTEYLTRNMRNRYALFFQAAGLAQTQVDEFVARSTQMHADTLEINPDGTWQFGQGTLLPNEERSILGDAAFAQLQRARQVMPVEDWLAELDVTIAYNATPLSSDQVTELTQVLATSSPNYATGKTVRPNTVNWARAAPQVQAVMTNAQWQQAQGILLYELANQQLEPLTKGTP